MNLIHNLYKPFIRLYCRKVPQALRNVKRVKAIAGKGGDGCISFLQLWSNESAGPDGGDGGNGGHVIFRAKKNVKDLSAVTTILKAEDGEKGYNKDCNGKSSEHLMVDVPIGTIIKNGHGVVIGDLEDDGFMFVAARGGAGGRGNHFFVNDVEQAPDICEVGAQGENLEYTLEIRSMAHIGLIGFPNAGKSTLLQAMSRARPKIAPYPFTTVKPHIGVIQYDDYEQIADLPGIIPDAHKNKGLGIQFLRHAERCSGLLYIIDLSYPDPECQLESLQHELEQFNSSLLDRPQIVIANKIDLPDADYNLHNLKATTKLPIIAISAKLGTNINQLLQEIRILYDNHYKKDESDCD